MYKPSRVALVVAVVCALVALPAMAEVRIVRLSDVQGKVQIDKNSGLGFEGAFLNLPLTQGTQLRTQDNGRAEIEFEDGSTLRITPNTQVEFLSLGANPAGRRTSAVNLVQGRVYVNWLGRSGDAFTLNFSSRKIELMQAAHFRVEKSGGTAEVASFNNEIDVAGPAGDVKVEKKKTVAFEANNHDQASAAKKIAQNSYDEWDKDSISYHDLYARNNSTPLGYGVSDLNYYGGYSSVSGFGTLWQPYFAGTGWNPFMDGAWSFYPGMGYMWASAYPWGWMPYYYGNWVYAPGFGWGWQAGGVNTWHGGVHMVGAVAGFQAPIAPKGTVNTVVVGRSAAGLNAPVRTVFGGTAGLGIARGSMGNLRQVNSQVAKSGFAQVQPAPQFAATSRRVDVAPAWAGPVGQAFGGPAARPAAASSAGHPSGVASGAHR